MTSQFLHKLIFGITILITTNQTFAQYFTESEITQIKTDQSASEGDMYKDTINNIQYIGGTDGNLYSIKSTGNKSIVINTTSGSLPNSTNTYYDFPVDNSDVLAIDEETYSVNSSGEITVKKAGVCMVSASLSVTNFPPGNTKYILGVFINGNLRGYLTRGFANLNSQDYWGTSGTILYPVNKDDKVKLRYVLNAGGTARNLAFANIGLTLL